MPETARSGVGNSVRQLSDDAGCSTAVGVVRPRNQDDPVGLNGLLLSKGKLAFGLAGLIDQHPPQSVAGSPALLVAEPDQVAGSLEDLC